MVRMKMGHARLTQDAEVERVRITHLVTGSLVCALVAIAILAHCWRAGC